MRNDPSEILDFLKDKAKELSVLDIASEVLNNRKFFMWAASTDNKHHYYVNGLLQHTYEVYSLCLSTMTTLPDLHFSTQKDVLFLGCLFHDIGKIYDYYPAADFSEWYGTNHKREIHHISRSAIIWAQAVVKYPKYESISDKVLHVILSHHGQREWGSPVMPHTKEAWLVHLCDSISARMDDCDKVDYLKVKK